MSNENHSAEVRILSFPPDRSLGWLIQYVPEEVSEEGGVLLGEARGSVIVPKDAKIELEIDWNVPADLAPLSALQPDDLYSLKFRDVALRSDELAYVRTLTGVRRLSCSGTKIGDVGLAHVQPLKHLEFLWLEDAQVTDAELEHVAALSALQILALIDNPGITDAGLAQLTQLSHLRKLFLRGTAATQAGVSSLRQSLPYCDIQL